MRRKNRKGQTIIEYTALAVLVIGGLVATMNYMKRGVQGRWKVAVDGLGDQYDPERTRSDVLYSLDSVMDTEIVTMNTETGFWTMRTDTTLSNETKTGTITVGSY